MTSGGIKCFDAHTVAIELDHQASSRLLERVQRSNASLTLAFSQCGEERVCDVQIQKADAQSIWLESNSGDRLEDILPSTCLEVQFALDGQAYFFSSSTLTCDEAHVEIGRPARLHIWQRRRFMRASVSESATVILTDATATGCVKGKGAMLNVSQDGLACRLRREEADRINIDEKIGVKFELGQERTCIEFCGRVKSKTAGGSANSIIVGVCFGQDSMNQSARDELNRLLGE
ncbi:MAG: hypothetical protein DHS20C16_06820 [Phycisphaerae bacterium]|nr:MAG: hypothetical protein DHS20C16_06820 [Phycisphaerae bacterium]